MISVIYIAKKKLLGFWGSTSGINKQTNTFTWWSITLLFWNKENVL